MIILQKILILVAMIMLGYIAYKNDMLNDEAVKKLSGIVVNIANPALIVSSVLDSSINDISNKKILLVTAISLVMYTALILIAWIVAMILPVKKEHKGMYQAMMVFSNVGFMGFPLLKSIYGNESLIYASIIVTFYNILIYTYGVYIMGKSESVGKFRVRNILNNGVIACLVMMFILLSKVHIPGMLTEIITYVSGMVVPASMMIIGASLATIKLKELFSDKWLIIFSIIRMILIPFIGYVIASQFIKDEMLLGIIVTMLAVPVGSLVAMLAQEYDRDVLLASKGIALTTILSVVTIPLVFGVIGL